MGAGPLAGASMLKVTHIESAGSSWLRTVGAFILCGTPSTGHISLHSAKSAGQLSIPGR